MTGNLSEKPLVTAIIPAYNRPKRTSRAIYSVINQSYEPIELIVIDDNSMPPIGDILRDGYKGLSDYQLIRHESNNGANAARNTGIESASGEYIAFLDSDDEWTKDKIRKQILQFQELGSATGIVYTGVKQVDEYGKTNSVDCPNETESMTKNLLLWNFIGTFSCVMARSSVFNTIGLLDERFPSWQDWEFYLRMSEEYDFGAVPEPLVIRHNGDNDQISSRYSQKRDKTFPMFYEKFEPLAENFGNLFVRKWKGYLAYHMARSAFRNQNYNEGRNWLFQSLRWYPMISSAYVHLLFALGGGQTYEIGRKIKRKIIRRTG